MKCILALAATSALLNGGPAIAKPRSGSVLLPLTQCNALAGYLQATDPAGRTVRAGPNVTARRLGTIAPPLKTGLGTVPASFTIIGSRNGWLLIENAGFDEELADQTVPKTYAGRGWISGKGVSVNAQASIVFLRPDHKSQKIIRVLDSKGDRGAFAELEMTGISACQGYWVLGNWRKGGFASQSGVAIRHSATAIISKSPLVVRGWVTGICDIQETSCDGLNGDTDHNFHK